MGININRWIELCCADMRNAKTRKEVMIIKELWTNHVPSHLDYILEKEIPNEFK